MAHDWTHVIYLLSSENIPARNIRNDLKDRTIHRMLQTSITGNHLKNSYHRYSKRQELQEER